MVAGLTDAQVAEHLVVSRLTVNWLYFVRKVCRVYQQNKHNEHIMARNRRQFSWLHYGSERSEVAKLYGEAQLLEG